MSHKTHSSPTFTLFRSRGSLLGFLIDNHLILSIFLYSILNLLFYIPFAGFSLDYFNYSFFKNVFNFIIELIFIVFYTFVFRVGLYILGKFISILWLNVLILLFYIPFELLFIVILFKIIYYIKNFFKNKRD